MILNSYLARYAVKWQIIVFLFMSSVYLLIDLMELLKRVSGKAGITNTLIAKMLLYRAPSVILEILPFIVFFGTILALWRLSKLHEIVVMNASGISRTGIIKPILVAGFCVGLADLLLFGPVATKFMERYEFLHQVYLRSDAPLSTASTNGLWLREVSEGKNSHVINARYFDQQGREFQQVTLLVLDHAEHFIERFDAERARILPTGKLVLEKCWHTTTAGDSTYFKELHLGTTLTYQRIFDALLKPASLSIYQIPKYARYLVEAGLSAEPYLMRWHYQISKVLWVLVLIVLAALFSMRHVRYQRARYVMGIGLGISFVLFFVREVVFALGLAGKVPYLLASWAPALFTLALVCYKLIAKQESVGS